MNFLEGFVFAVRLWLGGWSAQAEAQAQQLPWTRTKEPHVMKYQMH